MASQFETWALVELFGHNRVAGLVTEAELAGGKFIRIDVPQIGESQPVTRFYGPGAIYGITPMTKETAMAVAEDLKVAPMNAWDVQRLALPPSSSTHVPPGDYNDDADEDEEVEPDF
jgi:hypothetical protein